MAKSVLKQSVKAHGPLVYFIKILFILTEDCLSFLQDTKKGAPRKLQEFAVLVSVHRTYRL